MQHGGVNFLQLWQSVSSSTSYMQSSQVLPAFPAAAGQSHGRPTRDVARPRGRAARSASCRWSLMPIATSPGFAQRLELAREHAIEPVVIANRRQDARVGRQRDRRPRPAFLLVAADQFRREVLRIRRAAAIPEHQNRAALFQRRRDRLGNRDHRFHIRGHALVRRRGVLQRAHNQRQAPDSSCHSLLRLRRSALKAIALHVRLELFLGDLQRHEVCASLRTCTG